MNDQGQPRLRVTYPKYKDGEATVREAKIPTNYGQLQKTTIVLES